MTATVRPAAWLGSALRWSSVSDRLRFHRDPRVKDGGLKELVLSGNGLTVRVARRGEQGLTSDVNGAAQRTFPLADREYRLLAEEMSISGRGFVYQSALHRACRIAGETRT